MIILNDKLRKFIQYTGICNKVLYSFTFVFIPSNVFYLLY